MARQLSLALKTWGGKRKGAGRKPKGDKPGVSHLRRPKVSRHTPVHVTLRMVQGLPSLRQGELFDAVLAALAAGKQGVGFRLVHYSVQTNHVHLIVEADNTGALARGMKALCIRIARAINRERRTTGKVFSDRYHAHVLETPREVRHALAYVLNNFRKHEAAKAKQVLDPCASGRWFDGWASGPVEGGEDSHEEPPVVSGRSWLLTTGWRRHGLIDPFETPRCAVRGAAPRTPRRRRK